MKQVTIYTDGACSGNPGPGGWGAILMYGAHKKELSGGEAHTTNNRMELTGVITALEALNRVFQDMLELAEVEKSMQLLAEDIEKTRRRVNALEYVMIPEMQEKIRYITMKLDENERGNITRLMKVKEMVLQDAHNFKPA